MVIFFIYGTMTSLVFPEVKLTGILDVDPIPELLTAINEVRTQFINDPESELKIPELLVQKIDSVVLQDFAYKKTLPISNPYYWIRNVDTFHFCKDRNLIKPHFISNLALNLGLFDYVKKPLINFIIYPSNFNDLQKYQYLLDSGISRKKLLITAIKCSDVECFEFLFYGCPEWMVDIGEFDNSDHVTENSNIPRILFLIVKYDRLDIIKSMVSKGFKITSENVTSCGIYCVIKRNYLDIVEYMIDSNLDKEIYKLMMECAIKEGLIDSIKLLYSKHPDLLDFSTYPNKIEIWKSSLDIVKYLVQNGKNLSGNINFIDVYGNIEIMNYLMVHNVELKLNFDKILCDNSGRVSAIEYLEFAVQHGANIHYNNNAALQNAVKHFRKENIEYLLNKGADISVITTDLLIKCHVKDLSTIQFLLSKGVNKNVFNDKYLTESIDTNFCLSLDAFKLIIELHNDDEINRKMYKLALQKGRLEFVTYLDTKIANIELDPSLLVIRAVLYNDIETVKTLLDHIHVYNEAPFRYAAEYGYLEIVNFLIEYGVDVKAKHEYALKKSVKNNHLHVFKALFNLNLHIDKESMIYDIVNFNDSDIFAYILKNKSDVYTEEFLLSYLFTFGEFDVVEFVKDHNIDIEPYKDNLVISIPHSYNVAIGMKYLVEKDVDLHISDDVIFDRMIRMSDHQFKNKVEKTKMLFENTRYPNRVLKYFATFDALIKHPTLSQTIQDVIRICL